MMNPDISVIFKHLPQESLDSPGFRGEPPRMDANGKIIYIFSSLVTFLNFFIIIIFHENLFCAKCILAPFSPSQHASKEGGFKLSQIYK